MYAVDCRPFNPLCSSRLLIYLAGGVPQSRWDDFFAPGSRAFLASRDREGAGTLTAPSRSRLANQTALLQVFEQGRERPVDRRQEHALHLREVLAVGVEVLLGLLEHPRHRHQSDTGLDQPPGHEATAAEPVVAVPLDRLRLL